MTWGCPACRREGSECEPCWEAWEEAQAQRDRDDWKDDESATFDGGWSYSTVCAET